MINLNSPKSEKTHFTEAMLSIALPLDFIETAPARNLRARVIDTSENQYDSDSLYDEQN